MMPLPAICIFSSTLKPSTQGSESTSMSAMFISATLRRLSLVSSSQKDMMFSKTAMTVENAANIINTKNSAPTIRPPGMLLKMLESVVNRKLAPTVPASAVTPPL